MKKRRLPADFLLVISIVVAIFLSYVGVNQRINFLDQRIYALSREMNEKIDAISEKIDASNLQMGERIDGIKPGNRTKTG